MRCYQFLDLRQDNVVRAAPVVEYAQAILNGFRPVYWDGDAHVIVREPLDDLGLQERSICCETEGNRLAFFGGPATGVGNSLLQDGEVQ